MRVLVESGFEMSEKLEDRHYVHHRRCNTGKQCFAFNGDGIILTCDRFKKLPTGVKICLEN